MWLFKHPTWTDLTKMQRDILKNLIQMQSFLINPGLNQGKKITSLLREDKNPEEEKDKYHTVLSTERKSARRNKTIEFLQKDLSGNQGNSP